MSFKVSSVSKKTKSRTHESPIRRAFRRPGYGTVTGGLKDTMTLMDAEISMQTIVVAVADQVSCRLDEETVLLELRNGNYYGLNSVGTVIWEMIQQPKSVEAVCSAIQEQYSVDSETCSRDVLRVIQELRGAGLVEFRQGA